MPSNESTIAELFAESQHSAVHLEMRDHYGVASEESEFKAWLDTGAIDLDPASPGWQPWVSLVTEAAARGVRVMRARIVSEPVTDYIRYEHASTSVNLAAGEEVRWLARRRASNVALPGNDFWLFDDRIVRWGFFSGDGAMVGHEVTGDRAAAKLCAEAFAAVWALATPHEHYRIR